MRSPVVVTSVTGCGRSAAARAASPVAGGARLLRYATIARISASLLRLGGITLPGTPRRIVSKTRSSVAPDVHNVVRFGPLSPFASAPWHAAHVAANSVAPGTAAGACAIAARRPKMTRTTIGTREYTAPRRRRPLGPRYACEGGPHVASEGDDR